MRVLLTCHHRLHPNAGAPGLTLALGAALERLGCRVDYFGFQQAFDNNEHEGVGRKLRFPWKLAGELGRRSGDFDVIDATSGDAWLWASLRRPGHAAGPALLTRAHGLEHVAAETAREEARSGGAQLSWKYPIYHGGFRLWEVKRSLRLADHCVLYNSTDRDYAEAELGIAPERVSVVPNGIQAHFLAAPDVESSAKGPVGLAFVGSWLARKGTRALVEIVQGLLARGVDFTLAIVGSGEEANPLNDFPPEARKRVTVVPTYLNEQLPGLLEGREILIFPSRSEGFSVAFLEAMSCGLVPVAARAGAAPDLLDPARDGLLTDIGDTAGMANAVERLASDRADLTSRRRAAQQKARGYRWERIAADTLRLYERVRSSTAASTIATKRGPTESHV